jgi:hypothetical protein
MTNDPALRERKNDEARIPGSRRAALFFGFRHSDFIRHSSFVIRHLPRLPPCRPATDARVGGAHEPAAISAASHDL